MTHLLDGNLLIALAVEGHSHHRDAKLWFGTGRPCATCPITQGTLIRLLLRNATPTADALAVLNEITARSDHDFWADEMPYASINMRGVIGHRQVTDAYLAGLARARGGRLATFDSGLAALHNDVADLVGED